MLVCRAKLGYLVFADHRTDEILSLCIDRDEEMISEIVEKGMVFMDLIRKDKAPDPKRNVYVPTDRDAACWIYAARDKVEIDRLSERINALQERQTRANEVLKQCMGDFVCADFVDVVVKRVAVQGRIDYKKALASTLGATPR